MPGLVIFSVYCYKHPMHTNEALTLTATLHDGTERIIRAATMTLAQANRLAGRTVARDDTVAIVFVTDAQGAVRLTCERYSRVG